MVRLRRSFFFTATHIARTSELPDIAGLHMFLYTVASSMREQERTFPLTEVHTKIGVEGEIIFNQEFMEMLGVQPGDWIAFCIDEQGLVTVKGERKRTNESGTDALTGEDLSILHPDHVTQTTLFSTESEA
jgi:hypothetical protein